MINIEKFLDEYRDNIIVNYYNDDVFIALPFFHTKSDESIMIKISENENGLPVFSDCHTTEDYLELRNVELTNYSERLEKIIKRFGLVHDENVFRMIVPTIDDFYIKIYFGYFIQALSIIANIDL